MSHLWTAAVWEAPIEGAGRKLVAVALADCHNGQTEQCNPSVEYIAEKTGLSESQVKRHLADLCDGGWFCRDRARRKDGSLGVYWYTPGAELKAALVAAAKGMDQVAPTAPGRRTSAQNQVLPMRPRPGSTSATSNKRTGTTEPQSQRERTNAPRFTAPMPDEVKAQRSRPRKRKSA